MFTRDDFFKMLGESPLYKLARSSLKSDVERKKLDAFIADRFGSVAKTLAEISQRAENDPEFREELKRVVAGRERVVIDEAGAQASGSHG
jgi:hypothetical protein